MAYVSSFCLQWTVVFTLVFAQDSLWDCSDRDDILRDIPADVNMPSDCTLDCTARIYRAVLEMHNKFTIRFRDSHVGEAEEYCWSTRIKCSPGQSLKSAFILLPVDFSLVDKETLRLQISSETNGVTLEYQHTEYSLFPSECGLRFDVTQHLAAKQHQENLCVKIITQDQITLGRGLMCPPFLITTWEKWNQR